MKRDFDLIVYGATGYTGHLIAEYVLSWRRCSVLGDRRTLDRQASDGACRHRRARRFTFGQVGGWFDVC